MNTLRDRTASPECFQKGAFGHRPQNRLLAVQAGNEPYCDVVARPRLDGESSLADGVQAGVLVENLRDAVLHAQPGEAGHGQHHAVEVAGFVQLPEARLQVAPDASELESGVGARQLSHPPQRGSSHDTACKIVIYRIYMTK